MKARDTRRTQESYLKKEREQDRQNSSEKAKLLEGREQKSSLLLGDSELLQRGQTSISEDLRFSKYLQGFRYRTLPLLETFQGPI